jgi:hypothetical protein
VNSTKGELMFMTNKGVVGHLRSDDLQKIEGEIHANGCGMIRELHHITLEVSKTTIHEAVTEKLGYTKLCTCLVPKMLTDNLEKFKWDVFGPSTVQSRPHALFLHQKKHLATKKFDDVDEVRSHDVVQRADSRLL